VGDGSPFVEREKYQEEKTCDKTRNDDDDKQNRSPNCTRYVGLGVIECLKLTMRLKIIYEEMPIK
jgi:hypothetical protein